MNQILSWLLGELLRLGVPACSVACSQWDDFFHVHLSSGQSFRISGMAVVQAHRDGALPEGAVRCEQCKACWSTKDDLTRCQTADGQQLCWECFALVPNPTATTNTPSWLCAAFARECRQEFLGEWVDSQASGTGEAEQGVAMGRQEQPAPPRPVCACGQTVWDGALDYDGSPICNDCRGDQAREIFELLPRADLDARIRAAQVEADATSDWSAWAHPSSEGEQW